MKIIKIIIYIYIIILNISNIYSAARQSASNLKVGQEDIDEIGKTQVANTAPIQGLNAPTAPSKAEEKKEPKEKEIKVPEKAYNPVATKQLIDAVKKDKFIKRAQSSLRAGADPNAIDFEGPTTASVLGLSIWNRNNLEFVKLLLDWHANPNELAVLSFPESPLSIAIRTNIPNQIAIIKMLIDAQADVNKTETVASDEEKFLIDYAIDSAPYYKQGRGREIVKLLLQSGANPGKRYYDQTWLRTAGDERKDAFEGYQDYFNERAAAKVALDPHLPPVLGKIAAEYLYQEPVAKAIPPVPITPPVPAPAPKTEIPIKEAFFKAGLTGSPGPFVVGEPLTLEQKIFLWTYIDDKGRKRWNEAGGIDVDPQDVIDLNKIIEILG